VGQVDDIADNVRPDLQVGLDVDRGIRDVDEALVVGHVHDEGVADAPRRAEIRAVVHDLAHELVGVQLALHQRATLAGLRELDGALGGGVTVLGGHQTVRRDVHPGRPIGPRAPARDRSKRGSRRACCKRERGSCGT